MLVPRNPGRGDGVRRTREKRRTQRGAVFGDESLSECAERDSPCSVHGDGDDQSSY